MAKKVIGKNGISLQPLPRRLVLALAVVLGLAAGGTAFAADDTGDGGGTPPVSQDQLCIDGIQNAQFSVDRSTIVLGESVTVRWSMTLPPACRNSIQVTIGGVPYSTASGSVAMKLKDTKHLQMNIRKGSSGGPFATRTVTVEPPRINGAIDVSLDSNEQIGLFLRSISGEGTYSHNAVVRLANNIEFDLTGHEYIQVKPGVKILGGRSATQPGPLLFTRSYPHIFLAIGHDLEPGDIRIPADNVRISGIRLTGAMRDVVGTDVPDSIGIRISSSQNVQVDNCEVQGWNTSAIDVRDPQGRLNLVNGRGTVRIIGNSIHHNQRNEEGYGTEVGEGAYMLVERNTFDHNRHAVAGGGEPGTGYYMYGNHISNTGGFHSLGNRTHQVDMHGEGSWFGWEGYSEGGGERMDIRHNAIMYDHGNGVSLRGDPSDIMYVEENAFSHTDLWGGFGAAFDKGAMYEFYGNTISYRDNRLGMRDEFKDRVCDFDGDGTLDSFSSNGATWLYRSGAVGAGDVFYDWRYLNTSTLRVGDLQFRDTNSDGRCDVVVRQDGRVSLGGKTPLSAKRAGIVLRDPATGELEVAVTEKGAWKFTTALPAALEEHVVGVTDLDGDGDDDILTRSIVPSEVSGRKVWAYYLQSGVFVRKAVYSTSPNQGRLAALGDFDGDRIADTLWKDGSERLNLYSGRLTQAGVNWNNDPNWIVEQPWDIKSSGDFDGDGHTDLVWRHVNGQVCIWRMVANTYTGETCPGGQNAGLPWKIHGVGDFDGDSRSDLLWRYYDGSVAIWFGGNDQTSRPATWGDRPNWITGNDWVIEGVGDFNADGMSDILWRRTQDGTTSIWLMNGHSNIGEPPYLWIDMRWKIQGIVRID